MLHQIGSGVQGPVFRASDPESDRLIAVKAFRADLLPEQAERLARELEALVRAGFTHRSAVRLVAAGLEHGLPYLAMEYDAAETLDVVLRRGSTFDHARALALIGRLAGVLDEASAAGLGHGALHPRDVFLEPGDGVRITGIGVARAWEAAGVHLGVRRPYAAPERRSGGPWDVRADVYSLAMLAHDLLVGRRPTGAVGPPDEHPSHKRLGAAERRIFARALSADPIDRFESADAFASALSAAADHSLPLFDRVGPPEVVEPEPDMPNAPPTEPSDAPAVAAPADDESAARPMPAGPLAAPVSIADGRRGGRRIVPFEPPAAERAGFPWLAVAALVVAGAVLATAGYRLVARRPAPAPAAPVEGSLAAVASPDLTEVLVAPPSSSPAERPVASAAPRRRDRPAPARAAGGRLVVTSSPTGALVTVDGQLAGETPLTMTDVTLGRHLVLVARPGHVPESRQVQLTQSQPARALSVSLSPGVDGAKIGGAGALTVESHPRGARVFVDGRPVGTTPLRLAELRPGRHVVRLDLAGYRTLSTDVTVAAGPAGRLAVTLEPTGGRAPDRRR